MKTAMMGDARYTILDKIGNVYRVRIDQNTSSNTVRVTANTECGAMTHAARLYLSGVDHTEFAHYAN